jgi:hypothetical protein
MPSHVIARISSGGLNFKQCMVHQRCTVHLYHMLVLTAMHVHACSLIGPDLVAKPAEAGGAVDGGAKYAQEYIDYMNQAYKKMNTNVQFTLKVRATAQACVARMAIGHLLPVPSVCCCDAACGAESRSCWRGSSCWCLLACCVDLWRAAPYPAANSS